MSNDVGCSIELFFDGFEWNDLIVFRKQLEDRYNSLGERFFQRFSFLSFNPIYIDMVIFFIR